MKKEKTLANLGKRSRYLSSCIFFISILLFATGILFADSIQKLPLLLAVMLMFDNVVYIVQDGIGLGTIGVSTMTIFCTCLAFFTNTFDPIFTTVAIAAGAATIVLLIFFAVLSTYAVFPLIDVNKIDVAIVLGTKTENGLPGKSLERRLRKAEKLASKNDRAVFILSGGCTGADTVPEAEVMRRYLVDKITPERLIIDEKARNTMENLANAVNLAPSITRTGNICLITSNCHMFRARMIAKAIGLKAYPYSAVTPIQNCLQEWSRELFVLAHDHRDIRNFHRQNGSVTTR